MSNTLAQLPRVDLSIDVFAAVRRRAVDQLLPYNSARPEVVHLSCNSWGEVWVVTRRGEVPPVERVYVHEIGAAIDVLADLFTVEVDPRGGRFYVALESARQTRNDRAFAEVQLTL